MKKHCQRVKYVHHIDTMYLYGSGWLTPSAENLFFFFTHCGHPPLSPSLSHFRPKCSFSPKSAVQKSIQVSFSELFIEQSARKKILCPSDSFNTLTFTFQSNITLSLNPTRTIPFSSHCLKEYNLRSFVFTLRLLANTYLISGAFSGYLLMCFWSDFCLQISLTEYNSIMSPPFPLLCSKEAL